MTVSFVPSSSVSKHLTESFTGEGEPFLNDKNLCDIFTEMGEECLCQTCTNFPRHIEEFDDLYNPYSLPKKDRCREPTDGTIRYDYKRIKKMMKKYNGWTGGMYIAKNNKIKK